MTDAPINHHEEKARTGDAKGRQEASGHESPVSNAKPLASGVEGDVGVGTLGVVVRRGHASPSGVEASTGDQGGRRAGGGARQHLRKRSISLGVRQGRSIEIVRVP